MAVEMYEQWEAAFHTGMADLIDHSSADCTHTSGLCFRFLRLRHKAVGLLRTHLFFKNCTAKMTPDANWTKVEKGKRK